MLFRTNGIREVVGTELTADFAVRLGRDARTSSPAFSDLLRATLVLAGRDVVDLGLLPTPAVQYNIPYVGAECAVVVTASHNPPEYNGFKCLDERGRSAARETERALEAAIENPCAPGVPFDRIGTARIDRSGADRYLAGVLAQVDREPIARRRPTVVLDCGNGATAVTSPELLRRLGCRVVSLNAHPDGRFPGRVSEPNEGSLSDLRRIVPAIGADLGIAHDGDGDRTIFVADDGRFVPGEQSLALLARRAIRNRPGGVVVTPVSTSQLLEDVVHPLGGRIEYTAVGSPTLTREVERTGAVLGGEENGGVVFPSFQTARDGAMTAAAMLELLTDEARPLSALLDGLPTYSVVKEKVPCPPERAGSVLRAVAEDLGSEAKRVITLDGWKIYTDGGWTLLRRSGTEPILRIFAENRDPVGARRLADAALERVRAELIK